MKQKQLLNKPNELISLISEKKISIVQKKIYNIFLKNAQNIVKFDEQYNEINENLIYNFSIPCSIAHNSANIGIKDFEYIEKELEELMKILVNVVDKENKNNWDKFHLISRIKKKENNYEYSLIGNIVKALKEQTFFTTLDLLIVNSLSSQYSIIFYELAIRYKKYKIPKMSLEEVRELTGTLNEYPRFFDFRINVLEKACKEISEKTDIVLTYDTEKRGRNIAFIDFKIERKKEIECIKLKDDNITETAEKTYSEEVERLYEKIKEIERIESLKDVIEESIEKYGIERVESNIKYSNDNAKSNYTAYLNKAIELDYAKIEREKKKKKAEIKKKQEQLEEMKSKREEEEKKLTRKLAEEIYETKTEEEIEEYLKNIAEIVKKSDFFDKKETIIAIIIEELEQLY